MAITQLDVPQWKEPSNADSLERVCKMTGKLELWQQLPQEWKTSEEGQIIWQQLQEETRALDKLIQYMEQGK